MVVHLVSGVHAGLFGLLVKNIVSAQALWAVLIHLNRVAARVSEACRQIGGSQVGTASVQREKKSYVSKFDKKKFNFFFTEW